jgi:hypothetical protein
MRKVLFPSVFFFGLLLVGTSLAGASRSSAEVAIPTGFSCTCSCFNDCKGNSGGDCEIYVSCDSATACFACVSNCAAQICPAHPVLAGNFPPGPRGPLPGASR